MEDGATRLILTAPKRRFLLVGGTLWLIAWGFALFQTILALSGSGFGTGGYAVLDGLLLLWCLAWLAAGLFVIGVLLWGFFGHEVITISEATLTIRRTVFGRGPTHEFPRAELDNFRFRQVGTGIFTARSKWSIWGLGPGKVTFRYRGQSYSFGLGISDAEAQQWVELLA